MAVGACTAVRAYDGDENAGYLHIAAGEHVEVLYVGSSEDAGWAYGRSKSGKNGWFPDDLVQLSRMDFHSAASSTMPVPSSSSPSAAAAAPDGLCRGVHVNATRKWSLGTDAGYLSIASGDSIIVEHVGSSSDEVGWLYGRTYDGSSGWFPQEVVELIKSPPAQALSESLDTLIHRRADKPSMSSYLRDRPNDEETQTKETSRLVIPGERVQVLETCNGWFRINRIECKKGVLEGWIKARHLYAPMPARPCPSLAANPVTHAVTECRDCHESCDRASGQHSSKPSPGEFAVAPQQTSCAPSPSIAAPPPCPEILVTIYTFGLEKLDSELVNMCADVDGGGAFLRVETAKLHEIFRRHVKGDVHVFKDTRSFFDPSNVQHIGVHPTILSGMVANRGFRRWLASLRDEVKQAASQTNHIRVAFYCKSGRHRSVAGARLFKHCAEAEGWGCEQVEHLSRKHWKHICQGTCAECREDAESSERTEALRKALAWWRDAGPW